MFGYQGDSSDSSDDEDEAVRVGAEGRASFGRVARSDERWAQNHARSTEFIM